MKRVILFLSLCFACLLLGEWRSSISVPEADRAVESFEPFAPNLPAPPALKKPLAREAVQAVPALARLILSDGYCSEEGRAMLRGEDLLGSEDRSLLLYQALHRAHRTAAISPCVAAMMVRSKEQVLRWSRRENSTPCRLIRGLALTGQWAYGREAPRPSPQEQAQGLQILQELAREERGNGFFALAELGATQGDSQSQERAYLELLQSTEFESPFFGSLLELKTLGHGNATSLLLSVEIVSSAGTPDLAAATRAAGALAQQGLHSEELRRFAERLTHRLYQNEAQNLSWPAMSILDDALQRSIVMAGAEFLGGVPEALRQEHWRRYFRERSLHQDLTTEVNFDAPCTLMVENLRRAQPEIVREDLRQFREASRRAF